MAHVIHGVGSHGPVERILGLAGSLTRSFARRRAVARTLRELERLSERDLADIGLSRGGLREAAERAAETRTHP